MVTVLEDSSHGKLVPDSVRLSPPKRFRSAVGTMAVAVQAIVVATRAALLLTAPNLATSAGRCAPHVGS